MRKESIGSNYTDVEKLIKGLSVEERLIFGLNVKSLLSKRGMTNKAIALLLDIPAVTVTHIATGERPAPTSFILNFVNYEKLPPESIKSLCKPPAFTEKLIKMLLNEDIDDVNTALVLLERKQKEKGSDKKSAKGNTTVDQCT
ncbi:TPA: hypothetical protein ACN33X_001498 [Vibrio parahaemolyticus]